MDFFPAKAIRKTRDELRAIEDAAVRMLRAHMSRAEARRRAREEIEAAMNDVLFLSDQYQVALRPAGDQSLHLSIKRIDRQPIYSRFDMVQIGARFALPGTVPVELYVAESRVVDTANQYHLFLLPNQVPEWIENGTLTELAEQALRRGEAGMGQARALHLPAGTHRDWRDIQRRKNQLIGPEREMADLLLPSTLNAGPCLLFMKDPDFRFPVGMTSGLRSDAPFPQATQRSLSPETSNGTT